MSLKNNKFCILNKQYTKEEYEELMPRIIEHMKKENSYGEFFPVDLTVYGYNETKAFEWFPMAESEVRARGWKWREKDVRQYLPGTNEILACVDCGKNYRIIPYERNFYEKLGLLIPKKCPDCKHYERIA